MNFIELYLLGGLIVAVFMTVIWLVSLVLKNSSIVDIFWGPGFVLLAWLFFYLTPQVDWQRKLLMVIPVSIWGLRLSFYILKRNWGKAEDFRYRKWREEAGDKWGWLSLFRVFLLQGLIMWVISIPLLAAQAAGAQPALAWLSIPAVIVWAVGFFFEAVGDWQMMRFKADPTNAGRVMKRGLWSYTRHPNYFGDAVQWWGFFLLAMVSGGWWTIYSPLLMTFFLLRVSGVTLLEKTLKETRPGYAEYIRTTSAFVPWFPTRNDML